MNAEDASLTNIYNSVIAKGANQEGFTAGQMEKMNSQAVEGTAQNYAAASKALGGKLAAEGGGNNAMPTGAENEMQAELAASSAATESGEESAIQQADWEQGAQQFNMAMAGAAGLNNSVAQENAATGEGSAANTTMNDIAQENTAAFSAVTGAINGAAGAVSKFPL